MNLQRNPNHKYAPDRFVCQQNTKAHTLHTCPKTRSWTAFPHPRILTVAALTRRRTKQSIKAFYCAKPTTNSRYPQPPCSPLCAACHANLCFTPGFRSCANFRSWHSALSWDTRFQRVSPRNLYSPTLRSSTRTLDPYRQLVLDIIT